MANNEIFGRRVRIQVEDVVIDSADPAREAGLRIAFKVEKTLEPKPNKLEAAIFNLSEKTQQRLTKSLVSIDLQAGYGSSLGIIFKGDVRRIWHTNEGPNVITKVSSGDGDIALRGARFNESFAPGTRIADVLLKMADKLGVKADAAKQRIRKGDFRGGLQEFANGFTFSGPLQEEFDRRMREAGLTWSIQNGELQVLGEKETTQTTALRLSGESGLIGSPELGDKGVIKFKTVLVAELAPGRKVVLDSRRIKSTLRLKKVTYRGDSWGDEDFLCECEGEKTT